jgi:hypothetical protein
MVTVGMVQMAVHQIIRMVSMRHSFVATIGSVLVALLVACAVMVRCARRWVFGGHGDFVFVDVVAVHMVKVSVVQVVVMALMPDGGMPAIRAVHVSVPFVNLMLSLHFASPYGMELEGGGGQELHWRVPGR